MNRLLITLLLLFSMSSHAATEISPGVLYQPGTELQVGSLGLQLKVPANWQALLPQGAEILVMESEGVVARLMVSAVPGMNQQTTRQLMMQNQALDQMTQLQPTGQVQHKAGLFHQTYQIVGMNPQNLVAEGFGRLGDNGLAVFVVVLHGNVPSVLQVAKQLINGVTFTEPVVAQNNDSGGNSGPINWDNELRGLTLRYLKTRGGLSVDNKFNLCSDGSFSYSGNDSYASYDAMSSFSANMGNRNTGRWQVNGNRLNFKWADGSTSSYQLSRRYVEKWGEWGTFLDDDRWFKVKNEVCY